MYYTFKDHQGSLAAVSNGNTTFDPSRHLDIVYDRLNFPKWVVASSSYPLRRNEYGVRNRNRRLFGGKELQDEALAGITLNLYDFEARTYDPTIGRFLSVDPLSEKYYGLSPYSYCGNNPVMYSDPDGEFVWAPVIIGAMVSACFGGIRADQKGESFLGGMVKGAIVGGLGGVLGGIGGAGMSYAENLFLGIWEGGVTGAVDGLLFGEDPGKSMLYGMATGAIMTTLTSENLLNAIKGKGFKTNSNVFEDFEAGLYSSEDGCWQQDALDYFGFEGTYKSPKGKGGDYVESIIYYGSTNPKNGDISFGDLAFDSYDNLRATYEKELFHRNRILKGEKLETFELEGLEILKYYPEEAKGFLHAGNNNGLYPNSTTNYFNQANFYWNNVYGTTIRKSRFYDFIYKIPRRW